MGNWSLNNDAFEYTEDDIQEAKDEVLKEFAEFPKKNLLTNLHYHNGEAEFDYADIDGYVNEFKNQLNNCFIWR